MEPKRGGTSTQSLSPALSQREREFFRRLTGLCQTSWKVNYDKN